VITEAVPGHQLILVFQEYQNAPDPEKKRNFTMVGKNEHRPLTRIYLWKDWKYLEKSTKKYQISGISTERGGAITHINYFLIQ
jgi:hypothetical protein